MGAPQSHEPEPLYYVSLKHMTDLTSYKQAKNLELTHKRFFLNPTAALYAQYADVTLPRDITNHILDYLDAQKTFVRTYAYSFGPKKIEHLTREQYQHAYGLFPEDTDAVDKYRYPPYFITFEHDWNKIYISYRPSYITWFNPPHLSNISKKRSKHVYQDNMSSICTNLTFDETNNTLSVHEQHILDERIGSLLSRRLEFYQIISSQAQLSLNTLKEHATCMDWVILNSKPPTMLEKMSAALDRLSK